jgi:sugar lactone lactonase YvrE
MGKPSNTNPSHHTFSPLWIAILLVLQTHLLPAQTTVSATTVPLILPSAIVYDPQGNLYVAETGNHVIRKIDTLSQITTIAGTGTQGFSGDNGPATAAQLDSPQGLALDAANNLYIADTHNHRIRKLTASTQTITTIAGTSIPNFSGDSGPATSAQLNLPTSLALDSTGNLYFADSANHRIRRIAASTQTITTIAGSGTQGFSGDNGPATAAAIDSPTGLALDAANNLYLTDTHNHRIRRIDATTQTITTIAGDGTLSALALPKGLSVDSSGNLYLADSANHRIRRIDAATGQITTIAGNGTQTFSGDGGPAIDASLDSPRATALSPANLVTIADTGNQRIRQIDASGNLNPIGGLGPITPNTLSLTAAAVIAYGTGTIVARLTSNTSATGSVTFLDSTPNSATPYSTTTLATIPLTANTFTLSTASLPAGPHTITATYTGDITHLAAQSTAVTLTISPQPIQAVISPLNLLYGQPIPILTGAVTGILPQDATTVSITISTPATNLSPTGTYPIAASLTGASAGNYTLTATPASLTINRAPTLTTLSASTTATTPGTPITLTAHVASTTSGSPTGSLSILDGSTPLTTAAINSSGNLSFTTTTLITGSHALTAVYSGDTNFTTSTSAPTLFSITTTTSPSDFTLTSTTAASQITTSGSSVAFSFTTQTQGTLDSPITLAAAGLPLGATASFNPAYIPPGNNSSNFTLTISTPGSIAHNPQSPLTLALLLIPITLLIPRRRNKLSIILLTAITTLTTACGDRINTGAQSAASLRSYPITVTATATSPTGATLTHTAVVTLIIQSAQ